MDGTLFTIQNRARSGAAAFTSVEHFTFDEGQPASPTLLLDEPGWSPYCLDDPNRRVIFVNTPPEVDLSQAAFVYSAQFEQAQRAMAVPYAALQPLAEAAAAPDTLIFIYSIGRCGSTLLSKLLNRVDGVYSLSEPDVFTNLSYLRGDRGREADLIQVLKACTLLSCPQGKPTRPPVVALKFRSHAIGLSDWLHTAFPAARNIFMYRHAVAWAQSVSRFLQRLGYANQLTRDEALRLWQGLTGDDPASIKPTVDDQPDVLHFSDLLGLIWARYLERYMAIYERGVPFLTVRYEDLNDRRETSLRTIFDYCGLPTTGLERVAQGFETDSQAGTAISREIQADDLDAERVERLLALLSHHPHFNRPDFILPEHPRSVS